MTPSSHPETPEVDEAEAAVHAVLDGEATPEQRRLVARDPRLVARVEHLRQVAAAVADAPPPPPAEVLDRLRAAALDAGLGAGAGQQAPGGSAPDRAAGAGGDGSDDEDGRDAEEERPAAAPDGAVPLAPRRAARARRRWPALPAVAAAVLVLVAIGVGLIVTDADDGGAEQTASEALAEGAGGAAAPDFDVQGSYPSQEALREALQEADVATLAGVATDDATTSPEAREGSAADDAPGVAGEPAPADGDEQGDSTGAAAEAPQAAASDPAAQRCSTVLRSTDERIGELQAAVVVEVDGTALIVLSNPLTDGDETVVQLTVLDATSCVPQFAVRR